MASQTKSSNGEVKEGEVIASVLHGVKDLQIVCYPTF